MSIRITGTHTGKVLQKLSKANKSNDGREVTIDVAIGVDHEEAAKDWGQDFADLAFSSMRTRTIGVGDQAKEVIEHLQNNIKPSDKYAHRNVRREGP